MNNYIISYPRSGNTWLRYILEFLSEQPTNGLIGERNKYDRLQQPLLYPGENYIAHKLHSFDSEIQLMDSVLLIVRNYKECIIRHNKDKRGYDYNLFVRHNQGKHDDYIGMIKYFEQFQGHKMVLYYEDLIDSDKIPSICHQLCLFFDIPNNKIDHLIRNIDVHKLDALRFYPKSKTKGRTEIHHSELLSTPEKVRWDMYLYENFKDLYWKYLRRYAE